MMKKKGGVELGNNGYEVNRSPNISNEPSIIGFNQSELKQKEQDAK